MSSSDLLLHEVEVEGAVVDVLVRDRRVHALGPSGTTGSPPASADAIVVEGGGAALLPGLHDHHLHLLAMAAARTSVDCAQVGDRAGLAAALAAAEGGWVRAVGYDERIAGPLDRHALDRLVPDRPARVQHRTGSLWMLNSAALEAVGPALDDSPDVERDAGGRPTGRLWRYDARLRPALPPAAHDLGPVGRELLGFGITGVTDATPDLEQGWLDVVGEAHRRGDLPQRVTLLGHPSDLPLPPGFRSGPWKLHLRDHDLPSASTLAAMIRDQHERGRPVAVHCVTAEALVVTLAALDEAGSLAGDRVEHASVVPPALVPELVGAGVRVVTQPGFVRHRGDAYLAEVEPAEQAHLYPYRSLLAAGIAVAPSSDAPHAPPDPWQAIATAATRRTTSGAQVAPDEAVAPGQVLAGFLSAPDDPGGPPRRVEVGAPADLCLLDVPLARALAELPRNPVRVTVLGGVPAWTRSTA